MSNITLTSESRSITLSSDGRTVTIQQTGQPGRGIPDGGSTGQVLAKASATDYDTEWVDQTGGGGGSSTFIGLTDTPSSYTADHLIAVNGTADGLTSLTAVQGRTLLGLGSAALSAATDFATAAQGVLAGTAVQPGDLATVATTGAYSDLSGLPTLFSGAWADLTGVPTEFAPSAHTHTLSQITDAGTAAGSDTGDFAAASHTHPASEITDFATGADARIAAASIGDLADVNTTGLAASKILEYNGSAWVVIDTPSGGGGSTTLSGLSDVTISGPLGTTDVLAWNGSNWADIDSHTLFGAYLAGTAVLGNLSDVTVSGASAGEVLRWNGASWVNAVLAYADLSGTPTLATVATTGDYNDLINLPTLFSGSYNDLTDVPSTFAPAAHTLQSHSDVSASPATIDQVLKWNGLSSWIPASLAAGDIKSGTFADARIPSLAASKITSGQFADARISPSSVKQHEAALAILGSQVSGKQGPGAAFDGGGAVLTSGVIVRSPVTEAGTVTACYADADQSGSIDIIVRRYAAADTTYSSPTTLGTLSISSAQKGSLTGLSQAVAVGDTLEFELSGTIATIERLAVRSRI